jgi:hypothetical protein
VFGKESAGPEERRGGRRLVAPPLGACSRAAPPRPAAPSLVAARPPGGAAAVVEASCLEVYNDVVADLLAPCGGDARRPQLQVRGRAARRPPACVPPRAPAGGARRGRVGRGGAGRPRPRPRGGPTPLAPLCRSAFRRCAPPARLRRPAWQPPPKQYLHTKPNRRPGAPGPPHRGVLRRRPDAPARRQRRRRSRRDGGGAGAAPLARAPPERVLQPQPLHRGVRGA